MNRGEQKGFPQNTRSVCPVCLRPVPARRVWRENGIWMEKTCPVHGDFRVPVWRNRLDYNRWRAGTPLLEEGEGQDCPGGCGSCGGHGQGTCCALLEVTSRCDLNCRFCFAEGGAVCQELSLEALKEAVDQIMEQGKNPLLQLSGGEPAVRDDLPELVRYARERGAPYVQLNTNGIRLARDPDYVRRLARAGLSFVFLQFDGVTDQVYRQLRGQSLLETKQEAIRNCDACRLGVTLVPTVVRGVNEDQLGRITALGASLSPAVRGIHFQPVSYFGRCPAMPADDRRYTLDELLADLCQQTGLPPEAFTPSRCDHPMCGFHGVFLAERDGRLRPLTGRAACRSVRGTESGKGTEGGQAQSLFTSPAQNRAYVGRHWMRRDAESGLRDYGRSEETPDMAAFLRRVRSSSFTLTAMAFQDAGNLDIERLRRCSLHVYDRGRLRPFCARYLSPLKPGEPNI